MMNLSFILVNLLLGVGLAMDAFSVSVVDGLSEPSMRRKKDIIVAFTFGFFQFAMPLIGWVFVHTLVKTFKVLEKFIPWIAFLILCKIAWGMIVEGVIAMDEEEKHENRLTKQGLLVQAIATSIDALSVGFTIADYTIVPAIAASVLIGLVTFIICLFGILLGKKLGTKFTGKTSIIGGLILFGIGLKIIITYLFF